MRSKLYQNIRQKKLPPFGKSLAERQKFQNLPLVTAICTGLDSWDRAKDLKKSPNDVEAMVLDNASPNEYSWPVANCRCVVEWNTGPDERLIIKLVQVLLRFGAISVTVHPLFADTSKPIWEYDPEKPLGDRWVQTRETLQTYYCDGGVNQNVA